MDVEDVRARCPQGSRWRHMKLNRCYRIVAVAESATNGEEGEVVVVYEGDYGKVFCREAKEFLDGRFERQCHLE